MATEWTLSSVAIEPIQSTHDIKEIGQVDWPQVPWGNCPHFPSFFRNVNVAASQGPISPRNNGGSHYAAPIVPHHNFISAINLADKRRAGAAPHMLLSLATGRRRKGTEVSPLREDV